MAEKSQNNPIGNSGPYSFETPEHYLSVNQYRNPELAAINPVVAVPAPMNEEKVNEYFGVKNSGLSYTPNASLNRAIPKNREGNPYVLTFIDGSGSQANRSGLKVGKQHANYDLDADFMNDNSNSPWHQLYQRLGNDLIEQLRDNLYIEAHTGMKSSAEIVFAQAVNDLKHKIGVNFYSKLIHKKKNNVELTSTQQTELSNYENATDAGKEDLIYAHGGIHVRLVADLPMNSYSYRYSDVNKDLLSKNLMRADMVTSLGDSKGQFIDGTQTSDIYERQNQASLMNADEAMVIGDAQNIKDDLKRYVDNHYQQYDASEFGFTTYASQKVSDDYASKINLSPNTPNLYTAIMFRQVSPEAVRNQYFAPAKIASPYVQLPAEPDQQRMKQAYAWRDESINPASPVTVDELAKALGTSLANNRQTNSLKGLLNVNALSEEVPFYKSSVKDNSVVQLKAHANKTVRVIGTRDDNGQLHQLASSDVLAMQTVLSTLKTTGVEFELIPSTDGKGIDVKLSDTEHTRITLLNPERPYLVGSIQSGNGMRWNPQFNQALFTFNQDENQTGHALFAKYANNNVENGSRYTSEEAPVSDSKSESGRRIYTKRNGYVSDDGELENQNALYRYQSLDPISKLRFAVAGVTNLLGLDKRFLPDGATEYAYDDAGHYKLDADGKKIVNPNAYVVDDSHANFELQQDLTANKKQRFQRSLNLGGNHQGRLNNLYVVNADGSYTLDDESKGDITYDMSNVYSGQLYSGDYMLGAQVTVNPYVDTNPDATINSAYVEARQNYLKLLMDKGASIDDKVLSNAQLTFNRNLSDMNKQLVQEDGGEGRGLVTERKAPDQPLDVTSQNVVLTAVQQGLLHAKANPEELEDPNNPDSKKVWVNGVLDDALVNVRNDLAQGLNDDGTKVDKTTVNRRLRAFDNVVNQMNNTFGTAPLLSNVTHQTHLNLTPVQYLAKYEDEVEFRDNRENKVDALKKLNHQMAIDIVNGLGELPQYKSFVKDNDKDPETGLTTKDKSVQVIESLSYAQQRQVIDEIPHENTTASNTYYQTYTKLVREFDQNIQTLPEKYAFDKKLNLTQVIGNTLNQKSSTQYKNQMAQTAARSSYVDKITGDNDKAMLEVQERGVLFDKDHAYTAQELLDLDDPEKHPNNLDFRLHNYLDHVRGFKYVDADGNRVLDSELKSKDAHKVKVEPQINFSWQPAKDENDLNGNPYPSAFTGEGTSDDNYNPVDIKLINDVSPHRFLAERLMHVQKELQRNGANVNADSIKIDNQGVIHFDSNLKVSDVLEHQAVTDSYGYGYKSWAMQVVEYNLEHQNEQGFVPLSASDDSVNQITMPNGRIYKKYTNAGVDYVVYDGHLLRNNAHKEGSRAKLAQLLGHDGEVKLINYMKPVSGSMGQIPVVDYNGILTTNYHRFAGTDPQKGQKQLVPGKDGVLAGPQLDANGDPDMDAIKADDATGVGPMRRMREIELANRLDQMLGQNVNEILSSPMAGEVSSPTKNTALNSLWRVGSAMTKLPDSYKVVEHYGNYNTNSQLQLTDLVDHVRYSNSFGENLSMTQMVNYLSSSRTYFDNQQDLVDNVVNNVPDGLTNQQRAQYMRKQVAELRYRSFEDQRHPYVMSLGFSHAQLSAKPMQGLFGSSDTGQGSANGNVAFNQRGVDVTSSGHLLGNYVVYKQDFVDSQGIQRHKGEHQLDANGEWIPMPMGTAADYSDYNNNSNMNAYDRKAIAKEQFVKANKILDNVGMAMMSLGGLTMEDSMVISEDFAKKTQIVSQVDDNGQFYLNDDDTLKTRRLMIGDKNSDNGGNKATTGVVIPNEPVQKDGESDTDYDTRKQAFYQKLDDQHLLDVYALFNEQKQKGHPLEAVFGPMSQISRNNGATAGTAIQHHDNRFKRLDADGNEVSGLLTSKEVMEDLKIHPDAKYARYVGDIDHANYILDETTGTPDRQSLDYVRSQVHDDTPEGRQGKDEILSADKAQYIAEEDSVMTFHMIVKDENGRYVPSSEVTKTNATLNRGYLAVTDQLADQKFTGYDEKVGAKGRKLSYLAHISDLAKGAYHVANFSHTNGDAMQQLHAGLLTLGVKLDNTLTATPLTADDYASAKNVHAYQIPDTDMKSILDTINAVKVKKGKLTSLPVIDHDNAGPNDAQVLPVLSTRMGRITDSAYYDKIDNSQNDANSFGSGRPTNPANQNWNVAEKGSYRYYFDGYKTVHPNNDNTSSMTETVLTAQSKSFLKKLELAVEPSYTGAIANNSELATGGRYDAGGEFLRQLPDGGFLKLPAGVSIDGYDDNAVNELYIVPEKFRINQSGDDNQTIPSNLNLQYSRLGVALAKYETLRQLAVTNGLLDMDNPGQVKAFGQEVSKLTKIPEAIGTIQNEVKSTVFGKAGQSKYALYKNAVLGGYAGKTSLTSQLGSNPALPMDVVEIGPNAAKTLGFVPGKDGYAHMKGHPNWDRVHVHRDPLWREQGSLGFRVKINGDMDDSELLANQPGKDILDITNVRVNPVMVSMLDGDFDGDNVGLSAMPGEVYQKELRGKASVDRWMTDNNFNNSLLNINADLVDTANRMNPILTVHEGVNGDGKLDINGQVISGELHDLAFQKTALEHMNPEVFSASDRQNMFDGLDEHGNFVLDSNGQPEMHLKAKYLQANPDGTSSDKIDPTKFAVGDFLAKYVDSEIKNYYNPANADMQVADFVNAIGQENPDLDLDVVSLRVPGRNKQGQADLSQPSQLITGNLHAPEFRQRIVRLLADDAKPESLQTAIKSNQFDASAISDVDLVKMMVKNNELVDPTFKLQDKDQVFAKLDNLGTKESDGKAKLVDLLQNRAFDNYKLGRQHVDAMTQQMWGYEVSYDEKTGEVMTQRGSVSNLGSQDGRHGDGVNCSSVDTFRDSLFIYSREGAKGSDGKVIGLAGTKEHPNGYLQQPTQRNLRNKFMEAYNEKTGELDVNHPSYKEYQMLKQHITDLEMATQLALKDKTDATGTPGKIQQKLTMLVDNGSARELHAANALGQKGTQKVLGIKREAKEASVIIETLQNPVNELLRGRIPESAPMSSLMGPVDQGGFGYDPQNVAAMRAILSRTKDSKTGQLLTEGSFSDDINNLPGETVKDGAKVYSDDYVVSLGAQVGLTLDKKNKNQMEGFRNTLSLATQPYVRSSVVKDLQQQGIDLQAQGDNVSEGKVSYGGFVHLMDYFYNKQMKLDVSKDDIVIIADKLVAGIDEDKASTLSFNQKKDLPMNSINDLIKNKEIKSSVADHSKIMEEGFKGFQTAMYQGKNHVHLFGAYGSREWNAHYGLTKDEAAKDINLNSSKPVVDSDFDKLTQVEAQSKADKVPYQPVELSQARVDGRYAFASLRVSPKVADDLSVSDNDKVLVVTGKQQKLALHVKVDDKLQNDSGIALSKDFANQLSNNGETKLMLYAPHDEKSQATLNAFVADNMQSSETMIAYNSQNKDYRYESARDLMLLNNLNQYDPQLVARQKQTYDLRPDMEKRADLRNEIQAQADTEKAESNEANVMPTPVPTDTPVQTQSNTSVSPFDTHQGQAKPAPEEIDGIPVKLIDDIGNGYYADGATEHTSVNSEIANQSAQLLQQQGIKISDKVSKMLNVIDNPAKHYGESQVKETTRTMMIDSLHQLGTTDVKQVSSITSANGDERARQAYLKRLKQSPQYVERIQQIMDSPKANDRLSQTKHYKQLKQAFDIYQQQQVQTPTQSQAPTSMTTSSVSSASVEVSSASSVSVSSVSATVSSSSNQVVDSSSAVDFNATVPSQRGMQAMNELKALAQQGPFANTAEDKRLQSIYDGTDMTHPLDDRRVSVNMDAIIDMYHKETKQNPDIFVMHDRKPDEQKLIYALYDDVMNPNHGDMRKPENIEALSKIMEDTYEQNQQSVQPTEKNPKPKTLFGGGTYLKVLGTAYAKRAISYPQDNYLKDLMAANQKVQNYRKKYNQLVDTVKSEHVPGSSRIQLAETDYREMAVPSAINSAHKYLEQRAKQSAQSTKLLNQLGNGQKQQKQPQPANTHDKNNDGPDLE